MPTYNLIFHEDGHGVEKRVELEGQNVACVFSALESEAASRLVEVWTGEQRVALVERDRSGLWTVQSDSRTVSGDVGTLPGEKSRPQQHANTQEAST
ncbi:hypothetical protein [Qipengyuania seohaensis]|uniref:hypothetical protein n=1 Tax=Qipengyuania seohaensis TaxID=266951 RepID=UPI0012FE2B7E|nr:hypothetical protein [Qipengyuania seohaensis]